MTEDPAPRAVLYEGFGRAKLTVGERTWEDVPVVPLDETAPEPAELAPPALVVRPAFATAVALVPGQRVEGVELYHVKPAHEGGNGQEIRVRVREVRERKAKGDPFWSRVFKRKSSS